jgi:hypothetical protein
MRLEGSEFKENLPGQWEGKWSWGVYSGKTHIKINNIDGNNVQLTGYSQGWGGAADTDEVYGHIENSILLLTWPLQNCEQKYRMQRDDSNNFMLNGFGECEAYSGSKIQLKKIE